MELPGLRFGRERRLRKKAEFDAIFARRQRAFAGPLGLYVAPNTLGITRVGIAMSRKVGTAARRNRIKRLIREAFRLQQAQWEPGWDWIVIPKPHEPANLIEYKAWLEELERKTVRRDKGGA